MYLNIKGPLLGQALVCEPILRSLPEWFGIEEAIVRYLAEIASLPVLGLSKKYHQTLKWIWYSVFLVVKDQFFDKKCHQKDFLDSP